MSCRLSTASATSRAVRALAARLCPCPPPLSPYSSSSTASSPRPPVVSPPSAPHRAAPALDAVNELHKGELHPVPKSARSKSPPVLTLAQIRDAMVDSLATNKPRRALQTFLDALARRGNDRLSSRTVDGFAWLFCQYRQPKLARDAAAAMHAQGYVVTPKLASRLLRMSHHDLVLQPDVLAKVLAWISDGMLRDKRDGGKDVDEAMLETVLDVLKRMGRSDWLVDVLDAYRATLDSGQPGSPRLWALAISAKASEGDVRAAQHLFSTWRALYEAHERASAKRRDLAPSSPDDTAPPPRRRPPPADPYLALLHHFAAGTTYIATRDPAYKLVAVATEHGLSPSADLVNALLRTELHRRRWASFWGLWAQFDALALERREASWALAVKAKLWAEAERRQRGRSHSSPLHAVAPFPYAELPSPPSRTLFRSALSSRLAATHHRPSRILSTTDGPSSLSPAVLNLFLDLFVLRRDWAATAVVLETFGVHRIEPDARTHAAVVLGLVRLWERGRLSDEALARTTAGRGGARDAAREVDVYDEREQARRRRGAVMGGPQGVELIRTILEGRKMRVGLWRGAEAGAVEASSEQGQGAEEAVAVEGVGEDGTTTTPSPPAWMTQRETRDVGYLATLLQRCAGLDDAEWAAVRAEARAEMLPERTSRKVKKVKSINRGARFRDDAYGKAVKVEQGKDE
ncbi:uncharacterized protein RHOBADRAFT_52929, partial [Rhodotorula graminis WP1]